MAGINHHRQNYVLRMEKKKQDHIAAGLVSERFPTVTGMVIHMTYYQKAAIPLLMVRTLNISPSSYAYFKMDCVIKGCGGGGFDLTTVVSGMVKTHVKVKKGMIVCQGNSDTLSSDHASIAYETVITYKKR